MRSRFTRLGLMAVALLTLVGGLTPSAEATTERDVTFVGQVTLGGGLGYPVVTGTPGTGTMHCDLPLPGTFSTVPNCHQHVTGGNSRTIVNIDDTVACTNTGLNINKPGKPTPAHAGVCDVGIIPSTLNHVVGFCGLSGGQVLVTIRDALGQSFQADIHFEGSDELIITGHWRKLPLGTQAGLIAGEATAEPNVVGGSCTNKTATLFDVVAEVTFLP